MRAGCLFRRKVVPLRYSGAAGRRLRLRERQARLLPAVAAVGEPRDVAITHSEGALGRGPRHPAILLAIKDEELCLVAAARLREPASQIILGDVGERPVA